MIEEYANIYYFYHINAIGGIETFFYQLAKKYKDIDLTIVYRTGDLAQINRLKQYVRCIQFNGQQFKCKKAFFNFNTDIIDNVEADEYYLVIHGDYEDMINRGQIFSAPGHDKIDKYIGVSKKACQAFTKITGKKCELSYNPFEVIQPKKVLNLISATRLTREKGKQRMIQLAQALDQAKIPYIWTVFTNDTQAIDNPNIVYMKPRLDIYDYIANADYLVQLSDNEGYCYSVVEALSGGTPVIVTPCPVFTELGLKNGENCYILDFDMSNIPVMDIYNNIPSFTFTPPEDNWKNLFYQSKSTWVDEVNTRYIVEATTEYQNRKIKDGELNAIPEPGRRWEVTPERLRILQGNNSRKINFVKVIEKITK